MSDDTPSTQPETPVSRFAGLLFGRRRNLVVDARYQLVVAGSVAATMLTGVLVFGGTIHLQTVRLQEIVTAHDPNIARALGEASPIGITALVIAGALVSLAAFVLALVETHRVVGPSVSLVRTLTRLSDGHYTTPARVRAGDRLGHLAAGINELGRALTRRATADAELFDSVAERIETAKDENELGMLADELRDRAREKRLHLGG